jgi:hypothetical protein
MTTTFNNTCAQGDVYIFKTNKKMPASAKKVEFDGESAIITHSETGHHHVMEKDRVELYTDDSNPLISWLKVNRKATLTHLRPHDTHAPISFDPGLYEIRRQREHTPEGFRQVAD